VGGWVEQVGVGWGGWVGEEQVGVGSGGVGGCDTQGVGVCRQLRRRGREEARYVHMGWVGAGGWVGAKLQVGV
jgi:hypothetical protein